jgi:hypothetical protein
MEEIFVLKISLVAELLQFLAGLDGQLAAALEGLCGMDSIIGAHNIGGAVFQPFAIFPVAFETPGYKFYRT